MSRIARPFAKLLANLWFALVGLESNKLRSALTTLGIIIGVGAVIVIVSLGDGLRRSTEKQMETFTAGTIEIRPMQGYMVAPMAAAPTVGEVVVKEQMGGGMPMMRGVSLEDEDVEALRRLATSVTALVPQYETGGQVVCLGQYMPMGQINGVTPEFLDVFRREMKVGRFFTDEENEAAAGVAVLDEGLVTQFFGENVNPVGQILHVTVGGDMPQNLTVIGMLRGQEGVMGIGPYSILVPLRTAQLRLNRGDQAGISLISARVDTRQTEGRHYAVAEINTILRARHRLEAGEPEDFLVRDTLEYSEQMTQVTTTITLVLSLIAGISLIVGSIGLMNIMLVSVSERTWEIGLRRAIGARRLDILAQFLAEAVFLSLVGGLIGLALGAAGSYGVSLLVEVLRGMVWVSANVVLIALGISSAVGVAAGIYPAWRAALMPPTSALRHG